jgi:DNA-binding response OmpR family regulator
MDGKKEIVVVDDNHSNNLLLKEFLDYHFNILPFQSPFKALSYIDNNQPDIIISDLMMPELSGFEFLKKIRSIIPGSVFIFLTAHDNKDYQNEAFNLGADGYLLKPVDFNALSDTINELLMTAKTNNPWKQKEQQQTDPTSPLN